MDLCRRNKQHVMETMVGPCDHISPERRLAPDQLSGPIGIARMSHGAASLGFVAFVQLAAIVSLSLGLTNLLPVPLLDGGHLLFYALEAVRGRPLGRRSQEFGLRAGAALVLMLMLFVTANDLRRLFES